MDETVKVLLISPLPPPAGGIATWTKLFLSSDVAQANLVDLINSAIQGKRIKKLEKKYLIGELKRVASIYFTTRKFLKNDYDIVHINSAGSTLGMMRDYLCLKKAKTTRAKVIVHFHCDISYKVKGKLSKFIFRKICQKADQLFCLNQASEAYIKDRSNKESNRIPNFIDVEQINPQPLPISNDIKTVLFVGHVMKSKGCADLLKVAQKLPDTHFKLIGKVAQEIDVLPKPKNVQFCGEISKEAVLKEMQGADLLLFPTYTEGFPNVILEAMICGLPIISTPVGAIPEMLEDQGGILVEAGDVDAFIAAIDTLQDRTLRQRMSLWNQEKVNQSYTTTKVTDMIFTQYVKLLKNQVNHQNQNQPMPSKL